MDQISLHKHITQNIIRQCSEYFAAYDLVDNLYNINMHDTVNVLKTLVCGYRQESNMDIIDDLWWRSIYHYNGNRHILDILSMLIAGFSDIWEQDILELFGELCLEGDASLLEPTYELFCIKHDFDKDLVIAHCFTVILGDGLISKPSIYTTKLDILTKIAKQDHLDIEMYSGSFHHFTNVSEYLRHGLMQSDILLIKKIRELIVDGILHDEDWGEAIDLAYSRTPNVEVLRLLLTYYQADNKCDEDIIRKMLDMVNQYGRKVGTNNYFRDLIGELH